MFHSKNHTFKPPNEMKISIFGSGYVGLVTGICFVEQGNVDNIFHNPNHPYTKKLINAVPRIGSMKGKDFPEMFPESEIVEIYP